MRMAETISAEMVGWCMEGVGEGKCEVYDLGYDPQAPTKSQKKSDLISNNAVILTMWRAGAPQVR